jgi:cytochrome c biogenesis protein CcdA
LNHRDLAATLIKVAGAIILIKGLYFVSGALLTFWYSFGGIETISIAIPILLWLGASWLMIVRTEYVCDLINIPDSASEVEPDLTLKLQQLAFSILGVFFFVEGVTKFFSAIVIPLVQSYVVDPSWSESGSQVVYVSNASISTYVGATIEIVAGLLLFFGSGRLVALWKRFHQDKLVDYSDTKAEA